MQILGNYSSSLTTYHYQALVALLKAAIQAGGYGGGQAFDQAALTALQKQAQTFSQLPQPSAGNIVTDETFNNPFNLLVAQFAALANESDAFEAKLTQLLALLDKDTALVDQLLAEARLQYWVSTLPSLTGSTSIMWDFGAGYGPVADDALVHLWSDPAVSVTYTSQPPLVSQLATDQAIHTGIAPSTKITESPVNNLSWSYTAGDAQAEILDQDDWTKLTLLEPKPLINYGAVPVVSPAVSPFVIFGTSALGSLPVYVQTNFVPRRRHITLVLNPGQVTSLSPYTVDTDQVDAFTGFNTAGMKILNEVTDYTVDQFGNFTPLTLTQPTTVDIFFQEEFPAYQCSIDQVNWSTLLMLDPAQPYPDDSASFPPIAFGTDAQGNTAFPITDEQGNATGLYIQLGSLLGVTAAPTEAYLIEAYSPASQDTVGASAILEVDFARLGYINALRLNPFTTFPMVLKKVEVQGLTSNTREIVWSGSVALDRPTVIRLDQPLGVTPLVSKAFLTFYQPNYSLKQQTVTPPDALRRDVMRQLQAVLPFNARNVAPPPTQVYTGAQYEFGLQGVTGECWLSQPGVFVSGPNTIKGCPEILRFDASVNSTAGAPSLNTFLTPDSAVDFYLCYQAFNAGDQVVDENLVGVELASGSCQIFPFSFALDVTTVDHVDVYLKIVHRTLGTIVERYQLQITTR